MLWGRKLFMKNKQPIFIAGLMLSGTNILLNLLRSHPYVCSPRGETFEVFIIISSMREAFVDFSVVCGIGL